MAAKSPVKVKISADAVLLCSTLVVADASANGLTVVAAALALPDWVTVTTEVVSLSEADCGFGSDVGAEFEAAMEPEPEPETVPDEDKL